jgi:protein ImuB
MRLACLFVPLFPLAARLRSEPDLKGESVAVFEGNGNAARLIAATRKARKAGLETGMTLPQARAILPKLVARGRDRESERAAQEALLEAADTFSPRVEDGDEGVVYLDLDGLPALHPFSPLSPRNPRAPRYSLAPREGGEGQGEGDDPADSSHSQLSAVISQPIPPSPRPRVSASFSDAELSLGRDIIAAAEKVGLPARAGIAASKLAARVAAGLPESPTVVAPGQEAAFLAPLPLARLTPALEIAQMLERWGLSSIGELAKLPEGEVASRLGESGRELHATARGIDPRPLEARLPPPCFSEGMDLEWPLLTLEPFLFVSRAALDRLLARLESQALACTRLELTLKLDPDGCDARAIELPGPTRDAKTLLTLLRLELEARPPGSPVVGFLLTARPDRTRSAQLSLFGPAALSPDRLATTIARLASMLGADRIGSPRTADGHRPERYTIASFAPPPPPSFALPPKSGRGLLSVRVLRPPVALEVILEDLSASPRPRVPASASSPVSPSPRLPVADSPRLLSLKSIDSNDGLQISGSVQVAAGPWRMEEGWWTSDPADRDYWDVELSDGALYRVYRDRASGSWFADGVYD